jgi:hypothetical protein
MERIKRERENRGGKEKGEEGRRGKGKKKGKWEKRGNEGWKMEERKGRRRKGMEETWRKEEQRKGSKDEGRNGMKRERSEEEWRKEGGGGEKVAMVRDFGGREGRRNELPRLAHVISVLQRTEVLLP